MVLGVVQTNQ